MNHLIKKNLINVINLILKVIQNSKFRKLVLMLIFITPSFILCQQQLRTKPWTGYEELGKMRTGLDKKDKWIKRAEKLGATHYYVESSITEVKNYLNEAGRSATFRGATVWFYKLIMDDEPDPILKEWSLKDNKLILREYRKKGYYNEVSTFTLDTILNGPYEISYYITYDVRSTRDLWFDKEYNDSYETRKLRSNPDKWTQKGYYKNGKKDGLWVSTWTNGEIDKQEQYSNGDLVWAKQFFKTGALMMEKKNGYFFEHHYGLEIITNTVYKGTYSFTNKWYPNGYLISEEIKVYDKGTLVIENSIKNKIHKIDTLFWNEKGGKPIAKEELIKLLINARKATINDNEVPELIRNFYKRREKEIKKKQIENKEKELKKQRKGFWKTNNGNLERIVQDGMGNLISRRTYSKDSVLNGFFIESYINNNGFATNIRQKGYYKNGMKQGKAEILNEDSDVIAEFNYEKGLINGIYKGTLNEFYVKSDIRDSGIVEANFVNDTLHGAYKKYFNDGSYLETELKNGKFTGPTKLYYPSGKLKADMYYTGLSNGKLNINREYIEYFEDGHVKRKGRIMLGKMMEKWEFYEKVTNKKGEIEYKKSVKKYPKNFAFARDDFKIN